MNSGPHSLSIAPGGHSCPKLPCRLDPNFPVLSHQPSLSLPSDGQRTSVSVQFSSVQLLSRVRPFGTSWTAAHQPSLSITNSRSLLKFMSIESVMSSNHLFLCRPLLLPPSIFPCIRVFSNESFLLRWPKYWSFSFSISPSHEYSGLISFRMDWLDLLAVQGTLKESSTPQFKSISSSESHQADTRWRQQAEPSQLPPTVG